MEELAILEKLALLAPEILQASQETALMLAIGLAAAVLVGGPLGVLLFLTQPQQLLERRFLNALLEWSVNLVRSFPFIILMVAIVPFTRLVAGSSIGPLAAAVPLSIAAIAYLARLVEQSLKEVPRGVVEAAKAMGASPSQIVLKVLLPEARAGLVSGLTILSVSFLSYSAVAGVVGGGGIGDLAVRYGYYRYQTDVMLVLVTLLVVVVQAIQWAGNRLSAKLDKR